MTSASRRVRRRLGWLTLVLVAWAILLQATTTRGSVEDSTGQPVPGADVLLADGVGVRARTQTDARGHFRFFHWPLDRSEHSLLICAPNHGAAVVSPVRNAMVRSTYALQSLSMSAAFWTPARLGWKHPTPDSCPRDLDPMPLPA